MSCPHGHVFYRNCDDADCQKKAQRPENIARETLPPEQRIHQSELNRLVEQLHELRQALLPFSVFADALPEVIPGQPRITDEGPAFACKSPRDPTGPERVITFADLRRAHALLTRLTTEDEKRFIDRVERKMAGISDICIARDCHKPIPGAEPYHLAGFCSNTCEAKTAATHVYDPTTGKVRGR